MKVLTALVFLTLSVSKVLANSYAPTLNDIFVLNDLEDGYRTSFYQEIQRSFFKLDLDPSCMQVHITSANKVLCEAIDGKSVVVGVLDSKLVEGAGELGYYIRGQQVIFGNNVEIVKTKKNYALRVK